MRFLAAAISEIFVLALATAIVFIFAHFAETDYPFYSDPDGSPSITIGTAMGITDETGAIVQRELKKISDLLEATPVPDLLNSAVNIKVTLPLAKFFYMYWYIGPLTGILCLIIGIGAVQVWFRGSIMGLHNTINEYLIDKTHVYRDRSGYTYGHPGETMSFIVKLFVWGLAVTYTAFFGMFIIPIIALNLLLAVLSLIVFLIVSKLQDLLYYIEDKRDKKSETEKYSKYVDCRLINVANIKDEKQALFLDEYWNAVIVERALNRDLEGKAFSRDDAVEVIERGDNNKRYYYSGKQVKQLIQFNKEKREAAREMRQMHKNGRYYIKCENVLVDDKYKTQYEFGVFLSGYSVIIKNRANLSLILNVMCMDRQSKIFDTSCWNQWTELSFEEMSEQINKFKIYVKRSS